MFRSFPFACFFHYQEKRRHTITQFISYFLFIVVFYFLSNLSDVVLVFMALSFDMTFDTILSFELCYCVSSLFLIMKKAGKWKWSEHKVLITCFKPCPQNCEWNIWWLHSLHDLKTIARGICEPMAHLDLCSFCIWKVITR
jgi:hypothetical protein